MSLLLYKTVEISGVIVGLILILTLYSGALSLKGGEVSILARNFHITITPILAIVAFVHSLGGIHLMLKKRKLERFILPFTVIYTLLYLGFFILYFSPAAPTVPASSLRAASSPSEAGSLTPEEIAKHNSENDCWIIVEGKVYDVTSYINYHPGGKDAILPYCGKDATAAFVGKPHSTFAYQLLSNYYIGDLNGSVTGEPTNPVDDIANLVRSQLGEVNIRYVKPEEGGWEVLVEVNGNFREIKVVGNNIYVEEE